MSPWLLLLPLSLLALLAAYLRLKRALSAATASAGVALLLTAVCLALNTEPVYLLADQILGGANRAYLVVQVTFVLSMYMFKIAFVPGRRLTGRSGWHLSDTWVMILFLVAMVALFTMSDIPQTSYRLTAYHDQPTVTAFLQLVAIYGLGCGLLVFRQTVEFVRAGELQLLGRIGAAIVACSLVVGGLGGVLRLVGGNGARSSLDTVWNTVDGVLVVIAYLCGIVGISMIFLRRKPTK